MADIPRPQDPSSWINIAGPTPQMGGAQGASSAMSAFTNPATIVPLAIAFGINRYFSQKAKAKAKKETAQARDAGYQRAGAALDARNKAAELEYFKRNPDAPESAFRYGKPKSAIQPKLAGGTPAVSALSKFGVPSLKGGGEQAASFGGQFGQGPLNTPSVPLSTPAGADSVSAGSGGKGIFSRLKQLNNMKQGLDLFGFGKKKQKQQPMEQFQMPQYQGFQQEQPSQQDPYVSQVGGNMSGGYGGYGGGGDTKMGDYIRNLMKQRGSGFYSGREAGGMA